jgi:uncharacterized glyoxalase superfamily protein PhnB
MKIDAVSVTTMNMERSIDFYTILGFEFDPRQEEETHVEPRTPKGSARLMIDEVKVVEDIIDKKPKSGNHSSFAIRYDSAEEINKVTNRLIEKNFKVVKQPWDAFWGQRYAIVEDPDGYKVDLYCDL